MSLEAPPTSVISSAPDIETNAAAGLTEVLLGCNSRALGRGKLRPLARLARPASSRSRIMVDASDLMCGWSKLGTRRKELFQALVARQKPLGLLVL
eukprot:scaffold7161_cov109-Isochrysis_galbana.AAC.5